MPQPIYSPSGRKMVIAVGVSGSGTNFDAIYKADPSKSYIVFSNVPDCLGVQKARRLCLPVLTLDSKLYFNGVLKAQEIPRKGPERDGYDAAVLTMVETAAKPDLICLAGYDLWVGDLMVDRHFPHMLNVHPGDTTKGYKGLGWVPSAKAILAGDDSVKATVFLVDKTDDEGPVLIQSAPLSLAPWERELFDIRSFAAARNATTPRQFREIAEANGRDELATRLKTVSMQVQGKLKEEGDWKIYPFAVHELIAKGRAAIDGGTVYIDGIAMPKEGYQAGSYGFSDKIKSWV